MLTIIMAILRKIYHALGTVYSFSTFPFLGSMFHMLCLFQIPIVDLFCYKTGLLRSSKCTVETASLSWEEVKKSKFVRAQ